ncbi:hypothetical protein HYW18_03645 [Candidatus Uhrbacteria bacterium]|nr:hypothetical protein [Candidatus Uhrbacteria bacterium]
MSKTQYFDLRVKSILDVTQPGERVCALTGEKWNMTDEEIGWYRKFNVPPSKRAPYTRMRHLMGFVSGLALWKKPHAETGESIWSFVHPDSPFNIIHDKEWFSKEFLEPGQLLDSQRSFFDQLLPLAHRIPVGALRDDGSNLRCTGVDLIKCEDAYLAFALMYNRRVLHAFLGLENEDCMDVIDNSRCRFCFQTSYSSKCFSCVDCFSCNGCSSSAFLYDCVDCEFCFGASNQLHKKYLWWNEQLSKEEWEKRRQEVDLSSRAVYQKQHEQFLEMIRQSVWPAYVHVGSEGCTGEHISDSTRCKFAYRNYDSTDCFRCYATLELQESAFTGWGGKGGQMYECCDMLSGSQNRFCFRTWRSIGMEYSLNCYDCEHCFGCVGLRHKKFCILNQQYDEANYWQKLDELKCAMLDRGEYGEFFPAAFSEPGFQFSMGDLYAEYLPDELRAHGAPMYETSIGSTTPDLLSPDDLPDRADDPAWENFINKSVLDPILHRPFVVTQAELAFCRKQNVAVPSEHPFLSMKNRFRFSNGPREEQAMCEKCHAEVTTYRNSTFPMRRILCQKCYWEYLGERG